MNKQSGFTLIELVAVLVILALLGAMAVPRFVDMQTQAMTAAQNGSKNAVKSAHSLYIAENRAIPTVTQLAGYVNQDGTAATDGTDGVGITIDGTAFEVKTFSDNGCNNATTATAPNDRVLCVGGIGTP